MMARAVQREKLRRTDVLRFATAALRGARGRTLLMLTAMAIGVSAVIVLTSLGEGARRYVTGEFASLGTNLLIILPGRSETAGINPSTLMGETPRDLTLDDAQALLKNRNIRRIAPINVGSAQVRWQGRSRDVVILGANRDLLDIRRWRVGQGRFLPPAPLGLAAPVAVIGSKIRDELFGATPALGEWIRVGDRRLRVIGVMGSEGRSIGVDVEDTVIIPVATAQQAFNTTSLFRVLAEVKSRDVMASTQQQVIDMLQARHQGERDVTVITQDAVLDTFDRILSALTYAVAGIAAISLAVAGILIMNVMLIAVTQRTAEIGLLKALGASRRQIIRLILTESLLLSAGGAVVGLFLGQAGSLLIRQAFPILPAYAPLWANLLAVIVALLTGLAFSATPARRAARLDPVLALAKR